MINEIERGYCKKCIMRDTNPGVVINEEGVCNLCENEEIQISGKKGANNTESDITKEYKEFLEYARKNKSTRYYDCMFMLSGGKDSIYMLHKLVTKDKMRPLVFTLNHPFESKAAIKNIEKVLDKMNIEHINFTPNTAVYKKLLKHAFTQHNKEFNNNKLPCLMCSNFIRVYAYITALKMGIPYILYCADLQQIPNNKDRQIKSIMQQFIDVCGKKQMKEILGAHYDLLVNQGEYNGPRFVFPYSAVKDYDANKMIRELKEMGLYESSPWETHCSLHSLLNYYSVKKYDMFLYTTTILPQVRSSAENRAATIRFIEEYKDIYLNTITKEEISDEEKAYIKEFLKFLHPNSPNTLEFEYNDVLNLKKTAEKLDFDVSEIY